MIKTLLAQVKEYKNSSILSPVFVSLEVVFEVIIPLMMAMIIDNGVNKGNISYVVMTGILMILIALCSLLFGVLSGKYAAHASSGFAKNLREAMFSNIQTFSFYNIDKYSTAGLVTRLTTDVTNLQNAYQMILRMCTRAPIMLVCAMFMAFRISGRLSLIFVGALIFLGIGMALIITRAFPRFMSVFEKYDDVNASVQENVNAIRVVKAYVREEHEVSKFKQATKKLMGMFISAEKMVVLNMPLMQFAMYTCILLISWFGANMIVAGDLTTGQMMSLFSYVINILMSLMMISMVFVMITMAKASAERIVEVINEKTDMENNEKTLGAVADGSVKFKDVYFSYKKEKDNAVLRNINIDIPSGATVGIIGGTGSAKTSLVQLIARLYDVTDGELTVGGVNVQDYDMNVLRSEVSMVLQKNVLFSGTIKENLRWGNKEASDEELERVCKLAQADEFIKEFPNQYDTYIEQGGTNVSGGQKQRLCIARALLKKPKILILDDSTSAVDTKTDALIRKAFKEEIPDTTKIIIAQRIASIMEADIIIVLNEGEVIDIGSHQELIECSAIYREVYESQVKGDSEDGRA